MSDLTSLLELAGAQGGIVTTAQARALGWTRRALLEAVTRKELLHLCRSVYADPGRLPDGMPKGLAQAERHRLLCRGLLLVYPDAVLAACSAAVAHGLPTFTRTLSRCRLERPLKHQVDTLAACLRPRSGETTVMTELGPTVPVARAVAQIACIDGMTAGVVAGDAALHDELVSLADIQAVVDELCGQPGSAAAVAMLSHLDGRSESMGESRVRVLCNASGIEVIPQFVIEDELERFVGRVDLKVKGAMVVIEFDGEIKYGKDTDAVTAVLAEKKREERIRDLGYTVVRVTWSDLHNPTALLARIRAAIARAGKAPSPLAG